MEKPNQRRKFLGQLTAVSALSALGASGLPAKPLEVREEGEHYFLSPPYLQAMTPISVDIVFTTSNKSYSWVEYGISELNEKAQEEEDGLVEAFQRINSIRLKDLKPGTTYRYRVISKEITLFKPYELVYGKEIGSEVYSFTTPIAESERVSCLILNDIHDRPHSFHDLLSLPDIKPYDFVFLNGDMFDYQENEQQIFDHLVLPITALFASEKPFIMSRGNHETRGKFRREFKDYFSYPTDKYSLPNG
ncbi:FN3 domain-containing metallophosphoesterase family protein [Olivibacter sitiensis]|uniref:FN3 domain-containing metallophosphoesterase family protein n=1 Tax=Olivibacter sitiensis TaxID=376470 RepID=UPI000424CF8B|nr:FN3 domain-containing metallophosphoesterase family protein [Olivibacter sitiensis]